MYGQDILCGISKGTYEILHKTYLTHTLRDTILYTVENLHALKFKNSYAFLKCPPPLHLKGQLCGQHTRNHFVYAPSQWEMMLQCNIVSHWLDTYTKWSLEYWIIMMAVKSAVMVMQKKI